LKYTDTYWYTTSFEWAFQKWRADYTRHLRGFSARKTRCDSLKVHLTGWTMEPSSTMLASRA
jgi:hypothetical protein